MKIIIQLNLFSNRTKFTKEDDISSVYDLADNELDLFWTYTKMDGSCKIWIGPTNGNKQPSFWIRSKKKLVSARRIAFILYHAPSFKFRCKPMCGNEMCVAKDHLGYGRNYQRLPHKEFQNGRE